MKAVVSEFMEEDILREQLAGWDILYRPDLVEDRQGLLAALADADALIVRNRTRVDAELLARAPRLRVVGRLGVGLDNIDLAACKAAGVAVCPATGANDVSVAEYVIGAAMVLLRGTFAMPSRLAGGDWARNALMNGREMQGKRLGLVGFGSIARETALRGQAMGMRVAAHDPFVAAEDPAWTTPLGRIEPAGLDRILRQSDVISLHVPLTDATRHLIGPEAIAAMKDGAILVNAARGGVVDEAALAQALAAGRLGGAALDVFETEPLPADQARAFADLPNVILTPHIAGLSRESNRRVSEVTVASVRAHLAGEA
ncbi:hydroxyacid dehydrogenase [Paracoccus siganidrum]|uniref:3-phosphoglycerate dehydrogenase n=1 Tax=Paracoccus siganidrum TaxID=1276757 RepID=A0A419AC73_9RHOB|nr:hydroxyacid dehydrogenase [Paracoccus siganidrum]RJL21558.1 3-phosphoglycerate dehydrogenase [Paracoccus siganidrum]RMC30903.1 3-phosphoglycerate dehydrogenase [Paracoccus siganidrum]